MRSTLTVIASLVLLLVAPAVAHACPSCFAGAGGPEAFFLTFVLLTTLPLLAMGSIIYWLFRRAKRLDAARDPDARE